MEEHANLDAVFQFLDKTKNGAFRSSLLCAREADDSRLRSRGESVTSRRHEEYGGIGEITGEEESRGAARGGRVSSACPRWPPIIEPSCMFSLEDFHNPLTTGRRKNIYFTRLGE
jgi:hypothetical protein